jgi:hypothetical protein
MQVGTLILFRDTSFNHHRIWEVRSVRLGAVGVESLVELASLSERSGTDVSGVKHPTTWVPEVLLRNVEAFAPIIFHRTTAPTS